MDGRILNIGEALHNAKVNAFATWNHGQSSSRSERPQDASNRIFDGYAEVAPEYDGPKFTRDARLFAMGSGFARDVERELRQRGCNVGAAEQARALETVATAGTLPPTFFHRFTPFAMAQEFEQAFGEGLGSDEAGGFDGESLIVEDEGRVIDLNYWDIGSADARGAATLARRRMARGLVRQASEADLVVIALAQVESWIHKPSGLHANRVPAQTLIRHRDLFELHLASVDETLACLERIRAVLSRHRSSPAQIIVTVSPEPLAKTFTARDLIVANMSGKSVLCAAATAFAERAPEAHYFPGLEIVNFSNPQAAWRSDRTRVAAPMIDHVVNIFGATYYAPGEVEAKPLGAVPGDVTALLPRDAEHQLSDLNVAILRAVGSVSDLLDSALVAGPLAARPPRPARVEGERPAAVLPPPDPAEMAARAAAFAAPGAFSKSQWLAAHLVCPVCSASNFSPGGLTCLECGTSRPVVSGVPNFITEALAIDCRVVGTDNVSAHAYSPTVLRILEKVVARGGMALDCGSGSRSFTSEHLVQSEIAAYSNVDVLAVAQALPFKDDSFDAVMSLDVLEHVTDPFASAREIGRVLKPGGILFIDLPFLQPEHGYPHHYFNATRMGLRQLFDGVLTPDVHGVPNSGHPSTVMMTMLRLYRAGLARPLREEFDKLTVGELSAIDFKRFREGPFAKISDEILWKMPSTTQAIFSKAGERLLDIDPRKLPSFHNRPTFEG